MTDSDKQEVKNEAETFDAADSSATVEPINGGPAKTSDDAPSPVAPETLDPLKAALADIEMWKTAAQRIKADFMNYQDRVKRERETLSEFAVRSLIETLLPSLDNLDHCVQGAREQKTKEAIDFPAFDSLMNAIGLVRDSLEATLKNKGLSIISETNVRFDPDVHDAIVSTPVPSVAPEHIVEIIKRGYKWHGKTLRAAQVVVSAPAATSTKEPETKESE